MLTVMKCLAVCGARFIISQVVEAWTDFQSMLVMGGWGNPQPPTHPPPDWTESQSSSSLVFLLLELQLYLLPSKHFKGFRRTSIMDTNSKVKVDKKVQ